MKFNRIEKTFRTLRQRKKKALIAFITAGYPDLEVTEQLAVSFEKSGVDIIELGVPFSDPLADGPTIQAASQAALEKKVTLNKILKAVARIRKKTGIPIALMTYFNPVYHYGEASFVRKAHAAGVDGLIVPDLPPEEAGELIRSAKRYDMATIFFVSPTTEKRRIKNIARSSTGFIYYVSVTGVTGARQSLPGDMVRHVRLAKSLTSKPVCVGFGISTPAQVKAVSRYADGVIIGSVIIKEMAKSKSKNQIIKNVNRYLKRLSKALE